MFVQKATSRIHPNNCVIIVGRIPKSGGRSKSCQRLLRLLRAADFARPLTRRPWFVHCLFSVIVILKILIVHTSLDLGHPRCDGHVVPEREKASTIRAGQEFGQFLTWLVKGTERALFPTSGGSDRICTGWLKRFARSTQYPYSVPTRPSLAQYPTTIPLAFS